MNSIRKKLIRAGFEALYFSGIHHLMRPVYGGVGVIFAMHHVRPRREELFQPNHHLEITPNFLRAALKHVRASGVDIVTIDEAHRRLSNREVSRRFACFTFDDGYRDIRDFALPIMRQFNAPFTVYVTSDFVERSGPLWWLSLEKLIAKVDTIEVDFGGAPIRLDTGTTAAKQLAYFRICGLLHGLPNDQDMRQAVSAICARSEVDESRISNELCLSWDELKVFAGDPLVTVGAHTISHCNLARLSEPMAMREMAGSREKIEASLQRPAVHFAYPYGGKNAAGTREFALAHSAGFKTAVTTRPAMIFPESAEYPTALPRISINGDYQDERFLPVLTSGAATAIWNRFRRGNAA